jgi:Fe-S cluster assembly ATP-binding protein
MLEVKDLQAKIVESGQQILNGVSITVREGEVHAIMGKNGSGKSTLSKVLVGHPDYEVTGGTATYKGKNLFDLEPEERSHEGLFLSFQSPIEIPGVSNVDFLRMACNARRKALGQTEFDPLEFYAHVIPKVGFHCTWAEACTVSGWPEDASGRSSTAKLVCRTACMHFV